MAECVCATWEGKRWFYWQTVFGPSHGWVGIEYLPFNTQDWAAFFSPGGALFPFFHAGFAPPSPGRKRVYIINSGLWPVMRLTKGVEDVPTPAWHEYYRAGVQRLADAITSLPHMTPQLRRSVVFRATTPVFLKTEQWKLAEAGRENVNEIIAAANVAAKEVWTAAGMTFVDAPHAFDSSVHPWMALDSHHFRREVSLHFTAELLSAVVDAGLVGEPAPCVP